VPASVAEILRWDAGAVGDVARAATARATAAADVAAGLQRLPAFATWEGDGADAAHVSVTKLRLSLHAHADEVTGVATAANTAAGGVEKVQSDLRRLMFDAEDLGMEVDPASSRIVPGPYFRGTPAQLAANLAELEPRLDAIQAEAALVDEQFATAIRSAGPTPQHRAAQAVDFRTVPFPEKPPNPAPPPPPGGWSTDPQLRAAQKIAQGHAFSDHMDDFPGMTRSQLAGEINQMFQRNLDDPGSLEVGQARDGAPVLYDPKTNVVVIRDPGAADDGTVFKPKAGMDYIRGNPDLGIRPKITTPQLFIPPDELIDGGGASTVPLPPPAEPIEPPAIPEPIPFEGGGGGGFPSIGQGGGPVAGIGGGGHMEELPGLGEIP
jgi:hypothetical protein